MVGPHLLILTQLIVNTYLHMNYAKWDNLECSSSEDESGKLKVQRDKFCDSGLARETLELTEWIFLQKDVPPERYIHLSHLQGTDRGALAYFLCCCMTPPDRRHNLDNHERIIDALDRHPFCLDQIIPLA